MTDHTPDRVSIVRAHVLNRAGVLVRIANVFYRRGLNIEHLTAAAKTDRAYSTVTVHVTGEAQAIDRLALCLANLVDVLSVDVRAVDSQPGD